MLTNPLLALDIPTINHPVPKVPMVYILIPSTRSLSVMVMMPTFSLVIKTLSRYSQYLY